MLTYVREVPLEDKFNKNKSTFGNAIQIIQYKAEHFQACRFIE